MAVNWQPDSAKDGLYLWACLVGARVTMAMLRYVWSEEE